MENFQFSQLISEPTIIPDKTTTLIDYIFTSTPKRVNAVKVAKMY